MVKPWQSNRPRSLLHDTALVVALAVWDAIYDEPIYLVTTHTDLDYAKALYRRRAQIETYLLGPEESWLSHQP